MRRLTKNQKKELAAFYAGTNAAFKDVIRSRPPDELWMLYQQMLERKARGLSTPLPYLSPDQKYHERERLVAEYMDKHPNESDVSIRSRLKTFEDKDEQFLERMFEARMNGEHLQEKLQTPKESSKPLTEKQKQKALQLLKEREKEKKQSMNKPEKVRGKETKETFSFQIEPELLQRLREYAEDEERTVSAVIRLAIKKYLKE